VLGAVLGNPDGGAGGLKVIYAALETVLKALPKFLAPMALETVLKAL
jgi:hypothetical protein